jgi:hypothetical protein
MKTLKLSHRRWVSGHELLHEFLGLMLKMTDVRVGRKLPGHEDGLSKDLFTRPDMPLCIQLLWRLRFRLRLAVQAT